MKICAGTTLQKNVCPAMLPATLPHPLCRTDLIPDRKHGRFKSVLTLSCRLIMLENHSMACGSEQMHEKVHANYADGLRV